MGLSELEIGNEKKYSEKAGCCFFASALCVYVRMRVRQKKKDPATQQVLKISITPEPSPSPEPDKMDQNAVVKNGNITMVNEYLVNRGQAEDKETDSRADENSENTENPEPETDNGSDTEDWEDIIEE